MSEGLSAQAAVEGDAGSEQESEARLDVGSQVNHAASFNGSVTVFGDFNASGASSSPITAVDVTGPTQALERSFVEPGNFARLSDALNDPGLVVLAGSGCGARVCAGSALLRSERTPIFELPAGMSPERLAEGVERICRKHPRAGIVVEGFDPDLLGQLVGLKLRRLLAAVHKGAAMVLVTRADAAGLSAARGIDVIAAEPPPAERLVSALAADVPQAAIVEALAGLGYPPGPGIVMQMGDRLRANPGLTAVELQQDVGTSFDVLEEWLGESHDAKATASLAAAVSLVGLPKAEVLRLSAELARALDGSGDVEEPRTFGATPSAWPVGIITTTRQAVRSRLGSRETDVVSICSPHTRPGVLRSLWNGLDDGFRLPFYRWLEGLTNEAENVRQATAITAGLLFIEDPEATVESVLKPWAISGGGPMRSCAATALGVPTLFGVDPVPARRQTKLWASSKNPALRRTAISIYGGPLGAWDLGAGAPVRLWRAFSMDRELSPFAAGALGSLVTAGAQAAQARALVLQLVLAEALSDGDDAVTAFELLPVLTRRLVASDRWARESLTALSGPEEADSWAALARLFSLALDSPRGFVSGRFAFGELLSAVGGNRLEPELLNEFVREMKGQAAAGRRSALRAQLGRVLSGEIRAKSARGSAARALHRTFF